jgi:hypothetical protein
MPPLPRLEAYLGRHAIDSAGFAHELASERASALGRAGRAVEAALARLGEDREDEAWEPEDRETLLQAAAAAVWAFFVQREVCGLRDQRGVIAHYGISKAVLARLGARKG